jgi:hypothetical protein
MCGKDIVLYYLLQESAKTMHLFFNYENKFEHFHWWYGLNWDLLVKNWWRLVIKALECRPFRMTKPVSKRDHFWELVEWAPIFISYI